ncbi:hypothetical protein TRFO_03146 [Tritrichomonas foetus]|uniref:Initiator binding domain-containing protein n=1 Tax=Tritrichomonas foetus TaxID=1144522 RepID=A0A1J4KS63_9EUKA|nr:hypothetical protein TRFO_03146 [Tritrichomonas foetus]|eukprot:OHT14119.1 hypothetical protein TRFO_03146 [Tritrichomonas foetus]
MKRRSSKTKIVKINHEPAALKEPSDEEFDNMLQMNRNRSFFIFDNLSDSLDSLLSDEENKSQNNKMVRSHSQQFNDENALNDAFGPMPFLPITQSCFDFQDDNSQQYNFRANFVELNDNDFIDNDAKFFEACSTIIIDPVAAGLLPTDSWPTHPIPLSECVEQIFQTRQKMKMPYKLFNALKISEISHAYAPLMGVTWFSNEVIRINLQKFARLLGVKDAHKVLYSSHGVLARFGFAAMDLKQMDEFGPDYDMTGIDMTTVKLIFHPSHRFNMHSTIEDLESIKVASI